MTSLVQQFATNFDYVRQINLETIRGFHTTHVLIALIKVGFFTELRQSKKVDLATFARRENLDLKILTALCEYLYSIQILQREGDTYYLDEKGVLIDNLMTGPLLVVHAYENVFHNLEPLLRKQKKFGTDVNRLSEFVAGGSGTVGKSFAFPLMINFLRQGRYQCVLDLACGDATFLAALCQENENMTAYGLDIAPEAIELGNSVVARTGLQDRVQLLVEDMFNLDQTKHPFQGVDVVTCIHALHEFLEEDNERVISMLKKYKQRFPHVPLVILEVIRPPLDELRERPGGMIDILLFHDLSGQALTSREAWKALFQQAGFTNVKEDYFPSVRTAIFTLC